MREKFEELTSSFGITFSHTPNWPCKNNIIIIMNINKLETISNIYTAISRKVVKKITKMHTTRLKGSQYIHWNFAYWPGENVQVCIFACVEFVFPLRRPISVA